ncbi:MAG: phosphate ABC transporter permease subunit PstC [Candidatus Aminicenantales bacterium]
MRLLKDALASRIMLFLSFFPGLLVFLIVLGLSLRSQPILAEKSLFTLLFSSTWAPGRGDFGFFAFILGTLWVTAVALIVAGPISLLASIYLCEYAPQSIRQFSRPMIDLLAGLPSVVCGVWGVLLIVPLVSRIASFFGRASSGYSILAGGLVLAIMIFPTIIYVSLEVISSIPSELREASLSLGATKWETVKHVVLKKGLPGIIAAIVLGLSRALGETMAVLMVVGNIPQVPRSVFDGGYPLPALIANNYGEMMSVPLYDSALMLAAGVLLVIVLAFNVLARLILVRIERRAG